MTENWQGDTAIHVASGGSSVMRHMAKWIGKDQQGRVIGEYDASDLNWPDMIRQVWPEVRIAYVCECGFVLGKGD